MNRERLSRVLQEGQRGIFLNESYRPLATDLMQSVVREHAKGMISVGQAQDVFSRAAGLLLGDLV